MASGSTKPLRHRSPHELDSENKQSRQSQARRKYSLGLLEEAFKLSNKVGPTEAARVSGVNVNSLTHYRGIRMAEEGHKPKARIHKHSIDPIKKYKCYQTFLLLVKAKFSRSKRHCWIEAGKRTGINGRSVEFQVVRGIYKP